ncbi:GumC family protein [candidate division KSB1 bacterium]|nr:GumC family protein [candidate division KSB1 bacterium]
MMNQVQQQKPITLKKFVFLLFKRKFIFITLFISIVGMTTIGSLLSPSIYESTSKIILERDIEAEKAMLFRMNINNYSPQIDLFNAETEIIKSRPVAEEVIQQLSIPDRSVESLLTRLQIERPRNSNVINIAFQDKNPELACQVVHGIIRSFITYRSKIYSDSISLQFFDKQLSKAAKRLDSLQLLMARFKSEAAIISSSKQGEILSKKLADFENALTNAKTERIGREATLKIIKSQLNQNNFNIPVTEISDSPSQKDYLIKLKNQLLEFEMARERLLQKYKPGYSEVVEIENEIQTTKTHIRKEVDQIINQEETAIQALLAEEETLQNSIVQLYLEIKGHSQQEYKLSEINRDIEDTQEMYSLFRKQREEARISLAKAENNIKIRIIEPPVISKDPVKPKRKLNILLSILVSFGLIILATFIGGYFDHSLNTAEDIEYYLHLPLLASIREIKR